jgi:hypothetical protein
VVVAFWYTQRKSFVPVSSPVQILHGYFTGYASTSEHYGEIFTFIPHNATATEMSFAVIHPYPIEVPGENPEDDPVTSTQVGWTGQTLNNVLPPIGMQNGGLYSSQTNLVTVQQFNGYWIPTQFQIHFWGRVTEYSESTGYTVLIGSSVYFENVRVPSFISGQITDEAMVGITYFGDGYWYITWAAC